MDLSAEQKRRREFCDILLELAANQRMLRDARNRSEMYKRLERLYYSSSEEKQFRHFYSDIFMVLTQIDQDKKLGNIDILGQNLNMIRAGYKAQNTDEEGNPIDISDRIQKLYDHVSLDIARIRYSNAGDRKTSGEETISEIQSHIKQISNSVEMAANAQKAIQEELGKQQREYIAILGIFAAVVLAFTGGIAFSTSVLNNIAQASIYRTIAIALIVGLVLINVLFGLFYYINSIVDKDKKVLPLIVSNVVIILLLGITFIAWNNGFVEKRDNKFVQQQVSAGITKEHTQTKTERLHFLNRGQSFILG